MSFPDARSERPRQSRPPRGPVLVIVPHAGDELLGPGGTLALHAAQGDALHVLVVFDGPRPAPHGSPPGGAPEPGAPLALASHSSLELEGGGEATQDEIFALARRLTRVIVERSPATLYAPWHGELHVDPLIVSHAAALALELADFEGEAWGYELLTTLVPAWVVDVSAAWSVKRAGLEALAGQGGAPDLARALEGLAAHRSLLLPAGATHAEAFAHLLDLRIPVPRGAAGQAGLLP